MEIHTNLHTCVHPLISQLKHLGFAALAAPNPGAIIGEGVVWSPSKEA